MVCTKVIYLLQALSLYPGDLNGQMEPPPPYPMGTAASNNNPPPPSYSQTLAMRQSPTLSSASSDYRRSPHGGFANYPFVQVGGGAVTPNQIGGSSRSSSTQAWMAQRAKTHSPIFMQSVKSTQVQKPVLQTACGIDQEGNPGVGNQMPLPTGVATGVATMVQRGTAVAAASTNIVTAAGVVTGVATGMKKEAVKHCIFT